MIYDLIIIGAGAAGLFAAANAPSDKKILVLEKTDGPGKKLLLTGSGQCNITNNEPIKSFLDRYGENGKQLRPVLFPFSNIALMDFFEKRSLPLKGREDGKVFPASMKSSDVLELLLKLSYEQGVEFQYKKEVNGIKCLEFTNGSGYFLQTEDKEYFSKCVLVTTGGESYPKTGSDGSFFCCLEQLGLKLVPRKPALSPVFVTDYPYENLSGLTFPDCSLTLIRENESSFVKIEGSLLLTHKGFSGPCALEMSRYVKQGDTLSINYLPDKISDNLRMELIHAASGDKKQIVTILENVSGLPRSFLEFICENSNIQKNEKASRLTGREMGMLAGRLTVDSFIVSGTGGFDVAMTTAGGVCLEEIDLRTMEAKRYPGLFFAGEVLDVDGDTGGYNLQFAFSSAKRAVQYPLPGVYDCENVKKASENSFIITSKVL